MGDEDDTYELNLHAEVFPGEEEWPWSLTENDVPGASLHGKDPSRVNLPQLKLWLKCRGISATNMTKAQAVDVVTKSLSNHDLMKQPILDPKYPYYTDRKIQVLRQNGKLDSSTLKLFPNLRPPVFPAASEKWDTIAKTSDETIKYLKMFNNKTILDYFSIMADMRDTGFHNRALLRGNQHYAANHVNDLISCLQSRKTNELVANGLYIKAVVKASMRNVKYNTRISLYQYQPTTSNIKIRYAECSCVAGWVYLFFPTFYGQFYFPPSVRSSCNLCGHSTPECVNYVIVFVFTQQAPATATV